MATKSKNNCGSQDSPGCCNRGFQNEGNLTQEKRNPKNLNQQCCRSSGSPPGGAGQPDCANLANDCNDSYLNRSLDMSSKMILNVQTTTGPEIIKSMSSLNESSSSSDQMEESTQSSCSASSGSVIESIPAHAKKPQRSKNKSESGADNRVIMKYSPCVLLGNWAEELFLKEEAMKTFLLRRNRKELVIQNTRAMFTNLLKEAVVTAPGVSVKYGDTVQISCPDVPSYDKSSVGLCLSGVIAIPEIDQTSTLIEGCLVTASAFRGACARNVFKIVSLTPNKKDGDPVGYGDTVAFKLNDSSSDLELFIECEFPSVNLIGDSPYGFLKLSSTITRYCRFKPQGLDANNRDLVLGEPIPPNTKILIASASTNRNLCADTSYWMQTYFGPECQAVCMTLLDINKRILPENHWMFEAKVESHPSKVYRKELETNKEEAQIDTTEYKLESVPEEPAVPPKSSDGNCSAHPNYCTPIPKTDSSNPESEQGFSNKYEINSKPYSQKGQEQTGDPGAGCYGNGAPRGLSQNFPGISMGRVQKIANSMGTSNNAK